MAQRDKIMKWCCYALVTGLFVLLQSAALNYIDLWNVHPFLAPMLVAVVAMFEGRGAGINFALVFGFFSDLTISAPVPCFYMLVFALIALLTSVMAHRLFPVGFLCALAVSVMAMLLHALFNILLGGLHGTELSAAALLTGRELLISIVFVPLFYWLYRKVYRAAAQN